MRVCSLDYAEEFRRSLDQDKPGWTRESVWCRLHQVYHELLPNQGQRTFVGTDGQAKDSSRRPLVTFRLLPVGLPCFHESRGSALVAPCVYCGATLHAHKDDLGRVKSGRHGQGYLEERCPACHRANAVFPTYGLGGIRVTKLAEGAPAMQMKLG